MFVSENFKASEFLCKCDQPCNGKDSTLIDPLLVALLQDVRDHFNQPVTITSGLRCRQHNINVGGATTSRHIPEYGGYAADFKVRDVHEDKVADYLESKYPDKFGLGRYRGRNHVDTRQTKARWDYR